MGIIYFVFRFGWIGFSYLMALFLPWAIYQAGGETFRGWFGGAADAATNWISGFGPEVAGRDVSSLMAVAMAVFFGFIVYFAIVRGLMLLRRF